MHALAPPSAGGDSCAATSTAPAGAPLPRARSASQQRSPCGLRSRSSRGAEALPRSTSRCCCCLLALVLAGGGGAVEADTAREQ